MKLLNNWLFRTTAAALSVLIASCSSVRYEYTPPASEMGRLCVTQCQGNAETCRGTEINRVASERYLCEQRSEDVFRSCQRNAANKDEAKDCYRPACSVYENYWRCDEGYRQCFTGCGGTVQQFKN